jgi:hypothetical protein
VSKPDALCHDVLCDNIYLALISGRGWAHHVIKLLLLLQILRFDFPVDLPQRSLPDRIQYYATLKLPVNDLCASVHDLLLTEWDLPDLTDADPRTYAGEAAISVCRYARYMGAPDREARKLCPLPHTRLLMGRSLHIGLMRFRLGAWDLEVRRPAVTHNGQTVQRARNQRICRLCRHAGRRDFQEDELHVCLECPAYAALRAQYTELDFPNSGDTPMLDFMSQSDQKLLASYLQDLHALRMQLQRSLDRR